VEAITGTVDYHQYVILKQKEDGLFIHSNNYADQRTTFTLHGKDLETRVEPPTALLEKKRGDKQLTLTVGHGHPKGATRVYIK
jgi:hypothetical protein